jgi:imidazole glycerol-phosphate synthase subunit HisF
MLRPRVIPCLLIKARGLVKTVRFANPKYVGDPINAVRIFNEKGVDELVVLDIDATRDGREPDYVTIGHLASECRMPLCYGGGVKSTSQARRIIGLGVEKIAISSAAVGHPTLVTDMAACLGVQSVVVVVDVKRRGGNGIPEVWLHNGDTNTGRHVSEVAADLESRGAGEVVVNSMDRDGMMNGFDIELAREVRAATSLPLTLLGGAGEFRHVQELVRAIGVVGAAAGSLFVFKGVHKAVLISYPTREQRDTLVPLAGS